MNRAHPVLLMLALCVAAACQRQQVNAAAGHHAPTWTDSLRVVHDTIRGLPGLDAYAPSFPESVAVQGWLGSGAPQFLVISGFEPSGGDYTGPELFIVRPGERITWGVRGTPSPEYPGELFSNFDSLVATSRAFVGLCTDSGRTFVEFLRYRQGRKAPWRDSTSVHRARNDSLLSIANDPTLRLEQVLKRVASGDCHEIPAKTHYLPSDEMPPEDSG